MSVIEFKSDNSIKDNVWKTAYRLTKDIDENDTPFVALTLDLKAKLWTGDKALSNGLKLKQSNIIITTNEFKKLLEY